MYNTFEDCIIDFSIDFHSIYVAQSSEYQKKGEQKTKRRDWNENHRNSLFYSKKSNNDEFCLFFSSLLFQVLLLLVKYQMLKLHVNHSIWCCCCSCCSLSSLKSLSFAENRKLRQVYTHTHTLLFNVCNKLYDGHAFSLFLCTKKKEKKHHLHIAVEQYCCFIP